ncbi:MAG: response regulator transcription factor [Clostridia bacterium]|nr:response regulator transcription factor [Clostridia bacterium]
MDVVRDPAFVGTVDECRAFLERLAPGTRVALSFVDSAPRGARASRAALPPAFASLTRREREVAIAASEGLSNSEIAERLCVTTVTVKKHMTNVFSKLGVHSRAQLIRLVLCEGLGLAGPAEDRRQAGG